MCYWTAWERFQIIVNYLCQCPNSCSAHKASSVTFVLRVDLVIPLNATKRWFIVSLVGDDHWRQHMAWTFIAMCWHISELVLMKTKIEVGKDCCYPWSCKWNPMPYNHKQALSIWWRPSHWWSCWKWLPRTVPSGGAVTHVLVLSQGPGLHSDLWCCQYGVIIYSLWPCVLFYSPGCFSFRSRLYVVLVG